VTAQPAAQGPSPAGPPQSPAAATQAPARPDDQGALSDGKARQAFRLLQEDGKPMGRLVVGAARNPGEPNAVFTNGQGRSFACMATSGQGGLVVQGPAFTEYLRELMQVVEEALSMGWKSLEIASGKRDTWAESRVDMRSARLTLSARGNQVVWTIAMEYVANHSGEAPMQRKQNWQGTAVPEAPQPPS
jgi:hypothetical protein